MAQLTGIQNLFGMSKDNTGTGIGTLKSTDGKAVTIPSEKIDLLHK